jgi:hypothetical protein
VRIRTVALVLRRFGLRALAVACAAALAAAIAHVAIDLAGDFVLAHDEYDDIGHGSRLPASEIALLLGLLLALRLLLRAGSNAAVARGALRRAVLVLIGRRPWAFASIVAATTLVATALMEFADTVTAGSARTDVAALFGGSIPLGCGIAIAVALVVAFGLRRLLVFVAGSDAAIARLLESWLRGSQQVPSGSRTQAVVSPGYGSSFAGSSAARRAGKRAPPLLRA